MKNESEQEAWEEFFHALGGTTRAITRLKAQGRRVTEHTEWPDTRKVMYEIDGVRATRAKLLELANVNVRSRSALRP